MKIAVVLRQVPDIIEPLEIAASETTLNYDELSYILNESDDHALEQALLLKEKIGGSVTVVALDFGNIDQTLFTAAAKGADRFIKIVYDQPNPPDSRTAAGMFAKVISDLKPDLVLVGVQAYDELEGLLAPFLASALSLPYAGVIRSVETGDGLSLMVHKEFPGAALAQLKIRLPALLGILAANQPPRYAPIARVRAAMKTTQFAEQEVTIPAGEPGVTIRRLYFPQPLERAEILQGSSVEISARILQILREKGAMK